MKKLGLLSVFMLICCFSTFCESYSHTDILKDLLRQISTRSGNVTYGNMGWIDNNYKNSDGNYLYKQILSQKTTKYDIIGFNRFDLQDNWQMLALNYNASEGSKSTLSHDEVINVYDEIISVFGEPIGYIDYGFYVTSASVNRRDYWAQWIINNQIVDFRVFGINLNGTDSFPVVALSVQNRVDDKVLINLLALSVSPRSGTYYGKTLSDTDLAQFGVSFIICDFNTKKVLNTSYVEIGTITVYNDSTIDFYIVGKEGHAISQFEINRYSGYSIINIYDRYPQSNITLYGTAEKVNIGTKKF